MIESIQKIRKQFSDQWIFVFCISNPALLPMITKISFDIEKRDLSVRWVLPGTIHLIEIKSEFKND